MLLSKRSTIDILHKADEQFKHHDKRQSGAITSYACINALENIFSESLTQADIEEIRTSLEDIVEPQKFNDIVLKIKKGNHEKLSVDEDYIINNFSLKEISLFKASWEKFARDEVSLSFEGTRRAIEKVLKNYKNAQNNDTEIKQLFIKKANQGRQQITYAEYMNFISRFIKYRNLSYRKPIVSCFSIF